MSWLSDLARPDIVALEPYEHAAWEPGLTRLHANELPWRNCWDESEAGLNRYPEPQPRALIERLADIYGVERRSVLVSRGSDEAIDVLVRAFCRAGQDSVQICPPTFGMYSTTARIQGARVVTTPLVAEAGFALDADIVLERCTRDVKIVFLCSPNNPTGNLLNLDSILSVADALAGHALVVIDEAYVEFAESRSLARFLTQYKTLVVLRTLSKAYGLAGARCGALLANPEIIALLCKLLPPYAITQLTLEAVLKCLEPEQLRTVGQRITRLCAERERLTGALSACRGAVKVFRSDANFLLVRFADATRALRRARAAKLAVRDVRGFHDLSDALRITIGTEEENNRLLEAWR